MNRTTYEYMWSLSERKECWLLCTILYNTNTNTAHPNLIAKTRSFIKYLRMKSHHLPSWPLWIHKKTTALHSNLFTQILTQDLTQLESIMTQKTLTLTYSSRVTSKSGLSQVESSWFELTQLHKYKISTKPVLYGARDVTRAAKQPTQLLLIYTYHCHDIGQYTNASQQLLHAIVICTNQIYHFDFVGGKKL